MTEKQKEYHKNYSKSYYQENKEKFREYHKKWRTKNKERWKELCYENREKRVARLIAQGVINPWSVINKKAEPKYDK